MIKGKGLSVVQPERFWTRIQKWKDIIIAQRGYDEKKEKKKKNRFQNLKIDLKTRFQI